MTKGAPREQSVMPSRMADGLSDGLRRLIDAGMQTQADDMPTSPTISDSNIESAKKEAGFEARRLDREAPAQDPVLRSTGTMDSTDNEAPVPELISRSTDKSSWDALYAAPPQSRPKKVQSSTNKPTRPSPTITRASPPQHSTPGLCAGAALEGLDANKSATQLFYEWTGHGRPP
jgi:hypothetical protein